MATFHSFAGIDMHAVFGDVQFGELQMISYKSDREKSPVYTMGSADPRTIARGKRVITGALVFVVFEKDSLLSALNGFNNGNRNPYLSIDELGNYDTEQYLNGGSINNFYDPVDGTNIGGANSGVVDPNSLVSQQQANLADQLLPFDVTLVGVNEYGKSTKMIFHEIELMSESSGISIDDLVIEKQMSFIARRITGWNNYAPIEG